MEKIDVGYIAEEGQVHLVVAWDVLQMKLLERHGARGDAVDLSLGVVKGSGRDDGDGDCNLTIPIWFTGLRARRELPIVRLLLFLVSAQNEMGIRLFRIYGSALGALEGQCGVRGPGTVLLGCGPQAHGSAAHPTLTHEPVHLLLAVLEPLSDDRELNFDLRHVRVPSANKREYGCSFLSPLRHHSYKTLGPLFERSKASNPGGS